MKLPIVDHNGPCSFHPERDLKKVLSVLGDTLKPLDDRALLLEVAIRLPLDIDKRRGHLKELKPLVQDHPSLIATIEKHLDPPKRSEEEQRWEEEDAERKKKQRQNEAERRAGWEQFWSDVVSDPEKAFSKEKSENTAWNLWVVMGRDDQEYSGWNRQFMENQFGPEITDQLRLTLMGIWRNNQPTLRSERSDGERNSYLRIWRCGLAGIYAEAEDHNWFYNLSAEEAELAVRYALIEFNDFPAWLEGLSCNYLKAIDTVLGKEITWELEQESTSNSHSMLLQNVKYAPLEVGQIFLASCQSWLKADGDIVHGYDDIKGACTRLQQVLGIMLIHGDNKIRSGLQTLAVERLKDNLADEFCKIWLPTLMQLDPDCGVAMLEDIIKAVKPSKNSEAVKWFALLFGDRHDGIGHQLSEFAPKLLLRLFRLVYMHVRRVDDSRHEDCYTPDDRDNAEYARNNIVTAIFNSEGKEGWHAKLEMANDPLSAHFKDRILAVAEENWAQEIDSDVMDHAQAVVLDQQGEVPPSTNEAMFSIMRDRLTDLDDLLLRDNSPIEAWAGITQERVMRREIARELNHASNGLYKVDQESVTADEKETDIRLRSVIFDVEAVIELKLGNERSSNDLLDTIYNQLVKKYMVAENSRSGCLLITISKDRKWEHPKTKKMITVEELESLLCAEAERIEDKLGGSVKLYVHVLDLRPRLPKEKR